MITIILHVVPIRLASAFRISSFLYDIRFTLFFTLVVFLHIPLSYGAAKLISIGDAQRIPLSQVLPTKANYKFAIFMVTL